MTQRTTGLYRLGQLPRVYAAFQNFLGGERTKREIVSCYLRPHVGDRILDIGCGSASLRSTLGDVVYTGIGLNAKHIAAAREKHGEAGTFLCGDFQSLEGKIDGPFDLVMCIGVLHHLSDEQVQTLGRIVAERLAKLGRLVTIDPTFVERQNPIAHWLARSDSGRNVRTPSAYETLVRGAFDAVKVDLRHDLLRVPYTHCIITAQRN
jgi:SAM-dependent methyltransferase